MIGDHRKRDFMGKLGKNFDEIGMGFGGKAKNSPKSVKIAKCRQTISVVEGKQAVANN